MTLCCTASTGEVLRFQLQELTKIGRASDNDIQLFDESASERECELQINGGIVTVNDAGSTGGILVNGKSIRQATLSPGDTLQLGNTEFRVETDEVIAPATEIPATGCVNHPETLADWRCSRCGTLFCSACIVDGRKFGTPRVKFCPTCSSRLEDLKIERSARQMAEKSAQPLDPWKYPLRGDGAIILLSGAIFISLGAILQRFAFMLSGFVVIFSTGYLLAYSQKIITSSALGEYEPPTWPDFSDFTQDILPPFLQAIGLSVLYFLPTFLAQWFLPPESFPHAVLPGVLVIIATLLVPMAWLAISMHDSIRGLSPHFVIRSIFRIPLAYLSVVAQTAVAMLLDAGSAWTLDHLRIPLLPALVAAFLSVYFLMVASRSLGILYFRNRDELGWF